MLQFKLVQILFSFSTSCWPRSPGLVIIIIIIIIIIIVIIVIVFMTVIAVVIRRFTSDGASVHKCEMPVCVTVSVPSRMHSVHCFVDVSTFKSQLSLSVTFTVLQFHSSSTHVTCSVLYVICVCVCVCVWTLRHVCTGPPGWSARLNQPKWTV